MLLLFFCISDFGGLLGVAPEWGLHQLRSNTIRDRAGLDGSVPYTTDILEREESVIEVSNHWTVNRRNSYRLLWLDALRWLCWTSGSYCLSVCMFAIQNPYCCATSLIIVIIRKLCIVTFITILFMITSRSLSYSWVVLSPGGLFANSCDIYD